MDRTTDLSGAPMPPLTTLPTVSSYLASGPLLNAPRQSIDESIDQSNAQLKREMAFKATTCATKLKPTSSRHYMTQSTSFAPCHYKFALPQDSISESLFSFASVELVKICRFRSALQYAAARTRSICLVTWRSSNG